MLEESFVYYPDSLDFLVEDTGDIYYGKRLLPITRLHDVRPGIADLNAYICYLTLLLSTEHLTQRLTNQDIGNLNKIIENTTIWLNKRLPLEEEVSAKQVHVKQKTHCIILRFVVLPFRRM